MILFIKLILAIGVFLFLAKLMIKEILDKEFWEKPLRNFPFKFKGKTLWYSRSVATALFVFCKNANGQWCVLANKRGKGCPDFQGYWNCPCGYLDYNEFAQECAVRELKEECGLEIEPSAITFFDVDTNPTSNRQNVVIKYFVKLDGTTNDFKLSNKHMEENEVEDIKWVKISKINEYEWAFGHKDLITELGGTILN